MLKVAVAFAVSVVLTGCGCTTVGCDDALRIDAAALADWIASEAFTIEVCVDGNCGTALEVAGTSSLPWIRFPLSEVSADEIVVEITVTSDSETKHAAGTVALVSHRPNGAFCPPTCTGADITIDGDQVRSR